MEAIENSTNVLLMGNVVDHVFQLDAPTQQNIAEHRKWACVCTQWNECNEQWLAKAEGVLSNFIVNVLPVITELRDISTVIGIMKTHIWEYEVVLECLMLAQDWTMKTAPELLESQDNTGAGDAENIMDNSDIDDDITPENDAAVDMIFPFAGEYSIVGGEENVLDEVHGTESPMQELEAIEESLRNVWMQNEALCCFNDGQLDSIYAEMHIDDAEVCFRAMIQNHNLAKTHEDDHYIDEKKEFEYTNLVEIIVRVMHEFLTYYGYHDLKYQCLKCLANLVGFDSIRKKMGTRQILQEVMATTQRIHIKVEVWRGIRVLRALCDGNEYAKNLFIVEGGLAFIADMYRKCNTSKYILFDLCVFVYELCETQGDTDCVQIFDKTTLEFLRTSANTHVHSPRFMHNTCRTVKRIATNIQNKAVLIGIGYIALMQDIAQTHSDNQLLVDYTVGILLALQTL